MSDAMALARHEDDHEDSTRATEAFHRTFNFCMTCRQYACDACWNVKVGACLTCAPEPGLQAVAHQDHLIVRTPVAHWDEDWSLFPNGPAVEPLASSEPPAPFNQPILPPEPRPVPPAQPPTPEAWPTADVLVEAPGHGAGSGGKSGHRSARKPVDAEAASLWPLADEIAPEMTLTPEELELVETRLDAQAATEASPAEPALPSTPPSRVGETGVWAAARPPIPEQPEAQLPPEPSPIDRAPEEQGSPQHLLHLRFEVHPKAPRPHAAPPAPPVEHAPIVARLLGRRGTEDADSGAGQPRRGKGRHNQPAGEPWPHVTPWTERPVEAHDWWGETDTAATAPDLLPEVAAPASLPAAATHRPPEGPTTPPAPEPQATQPAPLPIRADDGAVDARSAAAVRLSAVGPDTHEPVAAVGAATEIVAVPRPGSETRPGSQPIPTQPPSFDLVTDAPEPPPFPEAPFPDADWPEAYWPEADRDTVVKATRGKPSRTPDRPAVRQPTAAQPGPAELQTPPPAPPNQWPPIGASWPAQSTPGAPWPVPETPEVPAVVVAQGATDQTLNEMWAQSAQEVLNRGSVRVCYHCALPVSTQARFCRRCGSRQS